MTKFKRVLSDDDLLDVYRSLDNPKRDRDSVIEAMGAAVEAYKEKLAEQEPDYYFYKGVRHHNDGGDHLNNGAKERGEPLYTHPCVSPMNDKQPCGSKNEKSESQIPDGTLIGEGTKRHIEYIKRYQRWRRGEDKTMDEMELTPKQIGESLDWLIGVAENHISKGINT